MSEADSREQTPPRVRHPPGSDIPPGQTPPRSRYPRGQTPRVRPLRSDTPRVRHPPLGQTPPWEQTHTQVRHAPQEQTPPRSRHRPGADTPRTKYISLGLSTPPLKLTQRVAGTDPTGMHSCSTIRPVLCFFPFKYLRTMGKPQLPNNCK